MNGENYYQAIDPSKVNTFFKPVMVTAIIEDVKMQILQGELAHKNKGQGVFIFDDLPTTRGAVRIAVSANWITNPTTEEFEVLNILQYHMFSGDVPDQLLDAITALGNDGKWTYPNNNKPE